jgi:hypothetical protein
LIEKVLKRYQTTIQYYKKYMENKPKDNLLLLKDKNLKIFNVIKENLAYNYVKVKKYEYNNNLI